MNNRYRPLLHHAWLIALWSVIGVSIGKILAPHMPESINRTGYALFAFSLAWILSGLLVILFLHLRPRHCPKCGDRLIGVYQPPDRYGHVPVWAALDPRPWAGNVNPSSYRYTCGRCGLMVSFWRAQLPRFGKHRVVDQ